MWLSGGKHNEDRQLDIRAYVFVMYLTAGRAFAHQLQPINNKRYGTPSPKGRMVVRLGDTPKLSRQSQKRE